MNFTQEELINKLKTRFVELDVDFDKFCEILIKYKAFISGSFLLQVIQNKYYNNSDIDIFAFGQHNDKFNKEIYDLLTDVIIDKIKNNKLKVIIENKSHCKFTLKNDDIYDCNNYPKSICIDTANLLGWKTSNEKGDMTDKTSAKILLFKDNIPIKIINHYRNINDVSKHKIQINPDYSFDKINAIVNFESENVLSKYQIIYYDDTKYNSPLDIITGFDLDFCKNYFDGKTFYVNNIESINSSSSIINLAKPRIYKNLNKRIIKYINRGFDIKVKYNDDIYDIIYLNDENKLSKNIFSKLSEKINNLIFICDHGTEITKILENLPVNLEKLIIYTFSHLNIIDNLPINLQELRLYIWKANTGLEDYEPKLINVEKYNKAFDKTINKIKSNIKRIPFACSVFINDEICEK